jgi:hypothetical protein
MQIIILLLCGTLFVLCGMILFQKQQHKEGFSSVFEIPNIQKDIDERVIKLQKKVKQLEEYYQNMDEKTPLMNDYNEKMIM